MIYTMAREVDERLRTRKYPVHIEYGPAPLERYGYASCITIERDSTTGDTLGPPPGTRQNPDVRAVRGVGVVAFVYVASTLPGARRNEHEYECDRIVDALVAELLMWGVEAKAGAFTFTEARYLTAEERSGERTWPGVAYVLRFKVPRAVKVVDYTGQARPTGTPGGVQNEVHVVRNASNDPPEVIELS